MTRPLYYDDAYIKKFEATLLEKGEEDAGRPYIVLDQTAFYPTGGGQPFDKGTLAGIPVIDVEKVNGEIRHFTDGTLEVGEGEKVEGVLDWERRYDHMQQHAGQHLISAIFADHFDHKTVSFHLGRETSSIDIDTDQLSQETVQKVEKQANDICYQQLAISTVWPDGDEMQKYPLRKPPTVSENIRLVIIDGVDYNACGGTHPHNTGEIGPVKILSWEKQKNNTRVYFVCGWRAIDALTRKHYITQSLGQTLSSPEEELLTAVDQLLIKQKELEKSIDEKDDQLLTYEVRDLLSDAEDYNGSRLITLVFQDRSIKDCQKLVAQLTEQEPLAVVILVVQNEDRLHLIASRGTGSTFNMNDLVKKSLPIINGRGGGKPERAQGGGEAVVTPQFFLNHVMECLEKESTVEG